MRDILDSKLRLNQIETRGFGLPALRDNPFLPKFDPRIENVVAEFADGQWDRISASLSYDKKDKNLAFTVAKPRLNNENGDIYAINNSLLIADGINPVDISKEERELWPISPDAFAAHVLYLAFKNLTDKIKGKDAPSPDYFVDYLVTEIISAYHNLKERYKVPDNLQPPSIIGGFVLDNPGKEKRVMIVGDGNGVFIMDDGSIVPIRQIDDDLSFKLNRIDVIFGALQKYISTPEVLEWFIKQSYEIKSILNSDEQNKLRKIVITDDEALIRKKLGAETISSVYRTVPPNAVAVLFSTDGMGPEEFVPYFILKAFLQDNTTFYESTKLVKVAYLNKIFTKTLATAGNNHEKPNGWSEDDLTGGIHIFSDANPEVVRKALNKAFMVSQNHVATIMSQIGLIKGENPFFSDEIAELKKEMETYKEELGISTQEEADKFLAELFVNYIRFLLSA